MKAITIFKFPGKKICLGCDKEIGQFPYKPMSFELICGCNFYHRCHEKCLFLYTKKLFNENALLPKCFMCDRNLYFLPIRLEKFYWFIFYSNLMNKFKKTVQNFCTKEWFDIQVNHGTGDDVINGKYVITAFCRNHSLCIQNYETQRRNFLRETAKGFHFYKSKLRQQAIRKVRYLTNAAYRKDITQLAEDGEISPNLESDV